MEICQPIGVLSFWKPLVKKGTTNQGISETSFKGKIIEYANLRFRSQSEVKVAQALDARSVMYLANCMARVGSIGGRLNREPDFLICYKGKWGILEIRMVNRSIHLPAKRKKTSVTACSARLMVSVVSNIMMQRAAIKNPIKSSLSF